MMRCVINRLVALALVPCLVIDPVYGSVGTFNDRAHSGAPLQFQFTDQALMLQVAEMHRPIGNFLSIRRRQSREVLAMSDRFGARLTATTVRRGRRAPLLEVVDAQEFDDVKNRLRALLPALGPALDAITRAPFVDAATYLIGSAGLQFRFDKPDELEMLVDDRYQRLPPDIRKIFLLMHLAHEAPERMLTPQGEPLVTEINREMAALIIQAHVYYSLDSDTRSALYEASKAFDDQESNDRLTRVLNFYDENANFETLNSNAGRAKVHEFMEPYPDVVDRDRYDEAIVEKDVEALLAKPKPNVNTNLAVELHDQLQFVRTAPVASIADGIRKLQDMARRLFDNPRTRLLNAVAAEDLGQCWAVLKASSEGERPYDAFIDHVGQRAVTDSSPMRPGDLIVFPDQGDLVVGRIEKVLFRPEIAGMEVRNIVNLSAGLSLHGNTLSKMFSHFQRIATAEEMEATKAALPKDPLQETIQLLQRELWRDENESLSSFKGFHVWIERQANDRILIHRTQEDQVTTIYARTPYQLLYGFKELFGGFLDASDLRLLNDKLAALREAWPAYAEAQRQQALDTLREIFNPQPERLPPLAHEPAVRQQDMAATFAVQMLTVSDVSGAYLRRIAVSNRLETGAEIYRAALLEWEIIVDLRKKEGAPRLLNVPDDAADRLKALLREAEGQTFIPDFTPVQTADSLLAITRDWLSTLPLRLEAIPLADPIDEALLLAVHALNAAQHQPRDSTSELIQAISDGIQNLLAASHRLSPGDPLAPKNLAAKAPGRVRLRTQIWKALTAGRNPGDDADITRWFQDSPKDDVWKELEVPLVDPVHSRIGFEDVFLEYDSTHNAWRLWRIDNQPHKIAQFPKAAPYHVIDLFAAIRSGSARRLFTSSELAPGAPVPMTLRQRLIRAETDENTAVFEEIQRQIFPKPLNDVVREFMAVAADADTMRNASLVLVQGVSGTEIRRNTNPDFLWREFGPSNIYIIATHDDMAADWNLRADEIEEGLHPAGDAWRQILAALAQEKDQDPASHHALQHVMQALDQARFNSGLWRELPESRWVQFDDVEPGDLLIQETVDNVRLWEVIGRSAEGIQVIDLLKGGEKLLFSRGGHHHLFQKGHVRRLARRDQWTPTQQPASTPPSSAVIALDAQAWWSGLQKFLKKTLVVDIGVQKTPVLNSLAVLEPNYGFPGCIAIRLSPLLDNPKAVVQAILKAIEGNPEAVRQFQDFGAIDKLKAWPNAPAANPMSDRSVEPIDSMTQAIQFLAGIRSLTGMDQISISVTIEPAARYDTWPAYGAAIQALKKAGAPAVIVGVMSQHYDDSGDAVDLEMKVREGYHDGKGLLQAFLDQIALLNKVELSPEEHQRVLDKIAELPPPDASASVRGAQDVLALLKAVFPSGFTFEFDPTVVPATKVISAGPIGDDFASYFMTDKIADGIALLSSVIRILRDEYKIASNWIKLLEETLAQWQKERDPASLRDAA